MLRLKVNHKGHGNAVVHEQREWYWPWPECDSSCFLARKTFPSRARPKVITQ